MSGRDYQQSKVYAWESKVVAPRDKSPAVKIEDAQALVTMIWMALGLLYPPRVKPMPPQMKRHWADATRTTIRMPATLPRWVLLHEIAHVLTSSVDDSDLHGPTYVGVYIDLLDRFLSIPKAMLWFTAKQDGVEFDPFAKPSILDAA